MTERASKLHVRVESGPDDDGSPQLLAKAQRQAAIGALSYGHRGTRRVLRLELCTPPLAKRRLTDSSVIIPLTWVCPLLCPRSDRQFVSV